MDPGFLKFLCLIFLLILSCLCIILNIILNFIFYIFRFKYDSSEPNLLISEIQNSFNGSLIESISLKEVCDGDEDKLILGIWDGTVEGCECNEIIYKQSCTDKQIEHGCSILYENPPINYTVFNSSYLCIKRTKLTYKEILKTKKIISNKETCPENYVSCGILDTLERQLCVKENEICPINTDTAKNHIFNYFNEKISFPSEYNYYHYNLTDNKTKSYLISNIKVIQFKPCINPNEKFWDYHYILEPEEERCLTEIKGYAYDDRFIKLTNSSLSKLQLYDDNLITGKLKNIEDINLHRIKKDTVNLYSINFLGFDLKELEESDFNLDDIIDKLNGINDSFFAVFIFSFIAIGSLILSIVFNLFVKGINIENGSVKVELHIDNIGDFFLFLFCLSVIVSPVIYFIIYSVIFGRLMTINSMLSFQSVDEYTQGLLELLRDESDFNFKFSLAMMIINIINLILFTISGLYFLCCIK